MHSELFNSKYTKSSIKVLEKKVSKYTKDFLNKTTDYSYGVNESSLTIAGDEAYHREIKKALSTFLGIKHVVLIGIGGSSLGTEAVYHALKTKNSPSLLILDVIDFDGMDSFNMLVAECEHPEEIALVVVSKSGTTTETMSNAAKALETAEKKFGASFLRQVIFIGDANSDFIKVGKEKNILCFTFPEIIGGRYSLFTAVGIVPLMLLRIDTAALRKGAMAVRTETCMKEVEKNAVSLAQYAIQGTHTVNFFTFSERLRVVGLWYRQLLAESIGKTVTTAGAPFVNPLLPVVSSSADLHSMAELYLGGYKHMFTHFISCKDTRSFRTTTAHWLLDPVPFLKKKSNVVVVDAIKAGVIEAYQEQKLPYRVTELDGCTAYEVGHLLASLMAEVMCVAHLLDIDPFHQPSVELYKRHTRARLNS